MYVYTYLNICLSRCIFYFSIRYLVFRHKIIQTVIKCLTYCIETYIRIYISSNASSFERLISQKSEFHWVLISWRSSKHYIHKIYIHKIFQTHFRVFQFNNYIWILIFVRTFILVCTYACCYKCVWVCTCNI